MKTFLALLLIISTLFSSSDSLRKKAYEKGLRPMPKTFESLLKAVDEERNPMTRDKIALGKKLFNDKNLSLDRTLSCASCHKLDKGGDDDKPTAIGYHKLENPSHLNTPTVLNTAYSKHFFWDGRARSLEEQAKGPTLASFEMASTPELINERMKENQEYIKAFDEVFDDEPSFNLMAKAIEVYEKTLITRGTFDEFLEGDDIAMSESAQNGLNLFIDMGCKGCHFGPAIGGQKIQKFPLRSYNNIITSTFNFNAKTGRRSIKEMSFNFEKRHNFPFSNVGGFLGKDNTQNFRVPILRNISKTGPYFHNGEVEKLRDAIFLMGRHQVGVDLNEQQLDDVEAFLKSLDGDLVEY